MNAPGCRKKYTDADYTTAIRRDLLGDDAATMGWTDVTVATAAVHLQGPGHPRIDGPPVDGPHTGRIGLSLDTEVYRPVVADKALKHSDRRRLGQALLNNAVQQ